MHKTAYKIHSRLSNWQGRSVLTGPCSVIFFSAFLLRDKRELEECFLFGNQTNLVIGASPKFLCIFFLQWDLNNLSRSNDFYFKLEIWTSNFSASYYWWSGLLWQFQDQTDTDTTLKNWKSGSEPSHTINFKMIRNTLK